MRVYQSRNNSARQDILGIIRDTIGSEDARLPSESELSRRIGLSVATIREALRTLEQEGCISKKHGMGNYCHASTMETRMRIDTILDFSDLLADAGHGVIVTQTKLRVLSAASAGTDRERVLCAQAGSLYRYDRVYVADDRPAILTKNYVPLPLISSPDHTDSIEKGRPAVCQENIIDLLWSQARIRVTHSIEAMVPGLADGEERRLFGLKVRTPLIRWSETFYTYDDSIVGYADVAFNPDIVQMHLLRKWS
jgi:GntR family transcriptional regulator